MPAIFALFRAAIPFVGTVLSGWALGDMFDVLKARKLKGESVEPTQYPAILGGVFKRNPYKWKFLAIGALITGALTVFLTKRLGK